jgi:hypothetical protein
MAQSVKEQYPNGECPDCGDPIPDDTTMGDECSNCGHVFVETKPTETCNYFVTASALTALRKLRDRLYSEERMSGEEMRDRAQWLDSFLENALPDYNAEPETPVAIMQSAIDRIEKVRGELLCDIDEKNLTTAQVQYLILALNALDSGKCFLKLALDNK